MNLLIKGVSLGIMSLMTIFAIAYFVPGNVLLKTVNPVSAQSVSAGEGKSCGQCNGECTASKNGCTKCGVQNGGVCGCSKK